MPTDSRFTPNETSLSRFSIKYRVSAGGCWDWIGTKANAYGYFWLSSTKIGAHVASFILFKGGYTNTLDVGHTCANPGCVNPDHLVQCTRKENQHELINSGRHTVLGALGAANVSAKLVSDDICRIRADNRSDKAIALDFNVTRELIGKIRRRQIWKHI